MSLEKGLCDAFEKRCIERSSGRAAGTGSQGTTCAPQRLQCRTLPPIHPRSASTALDHCDRGALPPALARCSPFPSQPNEGTSHQANTGDWRDRASHHRHLWTVSQVGSSASGWTPVAPPRGLTSRCSRCERAGGDCNQTSSSTSSRCQQHHMKPPMHRGGG